MMFGVRLHRVHILFFLPSDVAVTSSIATAFGRLRVSSTRSAFSSPCLPAVHAPFHRFSEATLLLKVVERSFSLVSLDDGSGFLIFMIHALVVFTRPVATMISYRIKSN